MPCPYKPGNAGCTGCHCWVKFPECPDTPHIALAGYDMEDAMILNKSSVDRGFAHASVYKSVMIDLKDEKGRYVCTVHVCIDSSRHHEPIAYCSQH